MAEVLDNAWDLSSTLRLVLFIATILSYSSSQLIFLVSVSAVKLGPLLHILTYSFLLSTTYPRTFPFVSPQSF